MITPCAQPPEGCTGVDAWDTLSATRHCHSATIFYAQIFQSHAEVVQSKVWESLSSPKSPK